MPRRLSHPLFTLLLALFLLFDASHLPSGLHGSRVGCWLANQSYTPTAQTGGGVSAALLLAPDGAWSIHSRETFITDPALHRDAAASSTLLFAELRELHWSRGFWAITSDTWNLGAYIYEPPSARRVSEATRSSARAAFLDWLVANYQLPSREAEQLRSGNMLGQRADWLGRARSLAALTAAILLILSLGWIPRLFRRFFSDSPEKLLARGLCPNCHYPLRGLQSEICPECGRDVGRVPRENLSR